MTEQYVTYKGTLFPAMSTTVKDLEFEENEFIVRDTDVFNITYPKSGTSWMIEILSLIRSDGDPTWSKTVLNWDRVPWIESPGVVEKIQQDEDDPRYITSHIPRHLFAKSFAGSKAKVIYTARNPKDIVVSLYYFAKMSVFYKEEENFDQFLKDFLTADMPYGSWFDHIKGWLEMAGKDNFLLNTYEDLQKDLRGSVERISKFLGKDLDDAALDTIVENVTFKNMKTNKMSNFTLVPEMYMNHVKSPFMRKGIVGDWKNHFTVAQSEYFDKIYKEKMSDFNMKFPWDES
ncbi:sulfotransferase 2B1-like isoform 1-T3 [Rhinophrynus dorsalis]